MYAGKLDKRITFQSKAESLDSWGGTIWTWSNVATVWAKKRPLRGRELIAAQAAQSESTDMFYARYMSGLDTSMRIVFGGKYYDIISIVNVNEENVELEITTKTGVSEG